MPPTLPRCNNQKRLCTLLAVPGGRGVELLVENGLTTPKWKNLVESRQRTTSEQSGTVVTLRLAVRAFPAPLPWLSVLVYCREDGESGGTCHVLVIALDKMLKRLETLSCEEISELVNLVRVKECRVTVGYPISPLKSHLICILLNLGAMTDHVA